MTSLFQYRLNDEDYDALYDHYEALQHCLDNQHDYGVYQAYKKDNSLFFLKDYQWYFKEPNDTRALPHGLRVVQYSYEYEERTGIRNEITYNGDYVKDFMVMMKTCDVGDVVLCSRGMKLFIHELLEECEE